MLIFNLGSWFWAIVLHADSLMHHKPIGCTFAQPPEKVETWEECWKPWQDAADWFNQSFFLFIFDSGCQKWLCHQKEWRLVMKKYVLDFKETQIEILSYFIWRFDWYITRIINLLFEIYYVPVSFDMMKVYSIWIKQFWQSKTQGSLISIFKTFNHILYFMRENC